ncbi:MAG: Asp-tRNA(Asn)/Glu-tRNA(Gln) amidotransferase subunit GatB [bacterium]|nr:Asp-tRNA(Asn)/Glu-tRNA(Gln) amidotransferase subunit GatB [bacterium]
MANKYYTTIGLEIHAELNTKTKMFCACKNDPDETKPNVNICPVCMAHPGALPVPNKKAIEQVIRVGLAIDGNIADFSEFDRKNYFYPDIPKGYQISQLKYPIVSGGRLANMDITRIHLEEDTANNKHDRGDFSLIDFNRAGVPLMELVTEPHTFEDPNEGAKVASNFAKEYQLLLQCIDASEANMEKGEMRVEANVSVSPEKDKLWKGYVEVKNLNSFKTVEKAIKYEVERMTELWEEGKQDEIVKETRGWDESKQKTMSQRKKESAEDYRYFPDPDLAKMKLHSAFDLEKMKNELPELPEAKRLRYKMDYEIKNEDIESYVNDPVLAVWFERVAKMLADKLKVQVASNYLTSDFVGLRKANKDAVLPTVENFAELINLVYENKISSRAAKDILAMIANKNISNDESPLKIATLKNLLQKNDEGELKEVVEKIISENPEVVATYKSGKENAIMSLVGKIIKETQGSANPQVVIKLLKELIK